MDQFLQHGEMGEFSYFSFAHFAPIFIMFLIIFLLYRFRKQIREYKNEDMIRIILAALLLFSDSSYFWHKIYLQVAEPANHLPITICGWAAILSAFMLLTKKQGLFDVVYFFVLAGSSNALITPAVIMDNGPTHFRYYQFWLEHTSIFIAVFYMIFVWGYRINLKSMFRSFAVLLVLGVIALLVNNGIEGANYLFLATTEAGDSALNFLPENLGLRILIMGSIITTLYILAYLPWFFLNKKQSNE